MKHGLEFREGVVGTHGLYFGLELKAEIKRKRAPKSYDVLEKKKTTEKMKQKKKQGVFGRSDVFFSRQNLNIDAESFFPK